MSSVTPPFTTAPEFISHLQSTNENSRTTLLTDLFNKMLELRSDSKQLDEELAQCRLQILESNVLISKLKGEVSTAQLLSNENLQESAVTKYKLSVDEEKIFGLQKLDDELDTSDPELRTGVHGKSDLFRIDDRFTGLDKSLYLSFRRQILIALSRNSDRYASLQSKITLIYQNLGPGPKYFLDRYLSEDGEFLFDTLDAVWEVLDVS
ncbi:hypothetical protein K3495_g584 [Podosphaera aphanis]|nr:hypothetical protein K3495_g584 [Podosphaera aphanis]